MISNYSKAILMAEFPCPFANIPPKQSTTNKICFSSASEQSQDSLLRCLSECFEFYNKSHLMNYEQSLFVMFVMCFLDDLLSKEDLESHIRLLPRCLVATQYTLYITFPSCQAHC